MIPARRTPPKGLEMVVDGVEESEEAAEEEVMEGEPKA
jgi:hypothetical protein